jgi:hypothetical protein
MTALEQLDLYLRRVEARLRLWAASRGIAIVCGAALLLTLLFVWVSNLYQFAGHVVLPLRLLLFAALAMAICFALAIPLSKLTRRRVTRLAEQQVPGFGERLLTVAEQRDASNPFHELVAEDALRVANEHSPEFFRAAPTLYGVLAAGIAAAVALIWLIASGPGYWGYGASLLWTGQASAGKRPIYEVVVQPGDKTVRRKSDQAITAQLLGFSAHQVTLHAKYGGAPKWESVLMQVRPDGNSYQFVFAGLADAVEYYVQADSAESKHFKLGVRDLPGVRRVRVALHYPAGLGLRDVTEDPGGDIRVVAGTTAEVSVLTDRRLDHGVLAVEKGAKIELKNADGNWLTATLPVSKDGSYHIEAIDNGENIRISDDYFIEAKKDEPPSIRIAKPGRDPHVTPIEEVPVTIEAADDFGLEGMDLHYSVNGGPEQVIPLLKNKGSKEASGSSVLSLENFKLVPGDLISMYATARDANTTSRSDIIFAQAEPFDFKFTQSQQAGGGGGGMGNQEANISERQKQIIAATWNEEKTPGKNHAALQEDAHFLADLESKLGAQAKTLADRMSSREMNSSGSEFENFSKLMTQASAQMNDAVSQLKPAKWQDALPIEQKALQSLLRAEAMFRDIQIAFGQQGGGGGGGGAQRDLARMFDLELDTSKNQYETGQSGGEQSSADQQKAIDEAFQKLQELARRQQELAQQNSGQQAMEQRWQEEQLRREAEELRRQMEQLAQNQQGSQQQQQSQQQGGQQSQGQGSQSSASKGGQSSSSGQNREMAEAMRRSSEALRRAENEMRKAVSEHDATAQRRASNELEEARSQMNKALHQEAGNSVAELSQKAQELANAQRQMANRMKQMYGQQAQTQRRFPTPGMEEGGGENEMPELNDPNTPRYYGYGRRSWRPDQGPPHTPTDQEKDLAAEKERLAQEMQELQSGMQDQAQRLGGTQPGASAKMRKALSDAEQKDLTMRMQKSAEFMRQGYGDRNMGMEEKMTAGLDQLSRDLRDVQQSLKQGADGDKNGLSEKQQQTLAQLRSLREMLSRGQDGGRQQSQLQSPGEQIGQQQGGQQQGGQQPGQQANGQAGGQANGQNPGSQFSPYGGSDPVTERQSVRNAIGQLEVLRGQIDPHDRALRGYVDDTLGSLRTLYADPNVLKGTISEDAVTRLERLEVELGRRMGEQPGNSAARSGAPEPSPEKYRDAVAEYFKKLSQTKP